MNAVNRLTCLLCLSLAALLPGMASADNTWRCGRALVSTGDRAFEVQQRCGAPELKQLVGYTTDTYGNREMQIEEWVYGPPNRAYYILTFVGGKLTNIEFRRGP